LGEHQADFEKLGARLAAIGMGDLLYAKAFREETGIRFPLLVDANRAAYRAANLSSGNILHIFRGDNARARSHARKSGFRQHRIGSNPFQLGGSFVFGPGNVDRFAHLSKTFSDNAAMADLLAALGKA